MHNKLLKDGSFIAKSAEISDKVTITGSVYISNNVQIKSGTTLYGPVYIGPNAFIGTNSLIRHNTSIGNGVAIGFGVEVRNSIIFSNTNIGRLSFIGDSVIGQNVEFRASIQTSNMPLSLEGDKTIYVNAGGESLPVPFEKFGTLIGNDCLLSNNVSIYAGKTIGNNCIILPNTTIDEDIPPNKLVSSKTSLQMKDIK